jgi:hypothetical protein
MENTKQADATAEPADDLFAETPIGIVKSMQAFMRDLPELLKNPKYDRWHVCYCGDERIGIAESSSELFRECKRRGLPRDQYYIGIITPKDPDEWTGLFLH